MKRIIQNFKEMTAARKLQCIAAVVLTVVLAAAVPTYAWFVNQKRAAEMYKIQYPNSLYVNAAHREDQIYFELDAVNVNEFERDQDGNIIYYTSTSYTERKTKIVDGVTVYDETGVPRVITSQRYVFSVFGSNADTFQLQLAYTNNNMFKYVLYPAQELTEEQYEQLEEKPANAIAREAQSSNAAHTMSGTVFTSDLISKDNNETYYYVPGDTALSGSYLNTQEGDVLAVKEGVYYGINYGQNTNVDNGAVPIYWQSSPDLKADPDANKLFCKHFILEITWDESRNVGKKETDLIAITVQRTG